MKNIHLIPTDKPSRLWKDLDSNQLNLYNRPLPNSNVYPLCHKCLNQHIYITNSEEIKYGDWFINSSNQVVKCNKELEIYLTTNFTKIPKHKIILTTDQDLIKDGVQQIDDDFLEWFVKNPSCEEVEVEKICNNCGDKNCVHAICHSQIAKNKGNAYKITIPKEEPKYPIGGFAPGNYHCTCVNCKVQFRGDKRAVQCEPCAIEMTNTKIKVNDKKGIEIDRQESLNLKKLELQLDNNLAKETKESLTDWLHSKRNKQESLEEAAKNHLQKWRLLNNIHLSNILHAERCKNDFIEGAKYQAERMYSEEEVLELLHKRMIYTLSDDYQETTTLKWFEQFKKK